MTNYEPLPYQWYEQHITPQTEVFGSPDAFPKETSLQLINLLDTSGERKHTFSFPYLTPDDAPNLPQGIADAVRLAQILGAPVNTAILKRYDIDDPYQISPYEEYEDPERFSTQRLVVINLSGNSYLTVTTKNKKTHTLPCEPGSIFLIAPNLPHSFTEQLNPSGVRDFLFLGYAKESEKITQ